MNKQKFVSATTKDGVVVNSDAEMLEVGVEVYVLGEDGTKTPAPDGVHELDNGMTITVAEGKITEISEASSEESLDAETVEVIQKAMESKLAAMQADFESKLAALEVKFSNQPAGEPATKKTDVAPVKMSAIEKVKLLTKKNK